MNVLKKFKEQIIWSVVLVSMIHGIVLWLLWEKEKWRGLLTMSVCGEKLAGVLTCAWPLEFAVGLPDEVPAWITSKILISFLCKWNTKWLLGTKP